MKKTYGDADKHLGSINIRLVYKDITVEMLRDPRFKEAARNAKFNLDRMYEEYEAARTRDIVSQLSPAR